MSAGFTERLPLSRHGIDRDYLTRADPELFTRLAGDPAARAVVIWNGAALLDGDALRLVPVSEVPEAELMMYLGRSVADGTPFVGAVLSDAAAAGFGEGARWGQLRDLGASLDDLQAGLFTEALALANWHASHLFSPRTGSATRSELGGWVRRADDDASDLFPRTDAAIIVGVTDGDDRMLLGHNRMWPANRYSLLAGFVEPGESLESAVVREVFEESGIHVENPIYLGSQPWPFPASLMLGFRATVDPRRVTDLAPDGEEIMHLRWFSREDLAASLDEVALPGGTSIARAILEDWFGGPIADRTDW